MLKAVMGPSSTQTFPGYRIIRAWTVEAVPTRGGTGELKHSGSQACILRRAEGLSCPSPAEEPEGGEKGATFQLCTSDGPLAPRAGPAFPALGPSPGLASRLGLQLSPSLQAQSWLAGEQRRSCLAFSLL